MAACTRRWRVRGLIAARCANSSLPAPSGRVERGRSVGRTAPGAAEEAAGGEEAGLVAGGDRLLPRAGRPAGPKSGPGPVGRARPGSKHHVLTDAQGVPLAVSLTGGNRGRRHPTAASARQGPGGGRGRGPATATAGRPARRPRLRSRQIPAPAVAARYPPGHRRTRPTPRLRPGQLPVCRRTHHCLAARLPSPAHPMAATRRHPREAFLGLATCLITYRHLQRLCQDF